MSSRGEPLRIVLAGHGEWPALGGFEVLDAGTSIDDAALARIRSLLGEALVLRAAPEQVLAAFGTPPWQALLQAHACVVLLDPGSPEAALQLVAAGVHEVLDVARKDALQALPLHVEMAVARWRRERDARPQWSTDLDTGLPNRQQLHEMLSQMLALRERAPAPMAVLALRLGGLAELALRDGAPAARSVRRKAAVRLRAAVRASDVVAALDADTFALLLAQLEAPQDVERVVAKLEQALRKPLQTQGQSLRLRAYVGAALHPEHGREAAALLQRALEQIDSAARIGTDAAND